MEAYYFGDWLKEQRLFLNLTQKDLALKTKGKINQSVISMWENKEIEIPSINNIMVIIEALGLSLRSVPFDHFHITKNENVPTQRSDRVSERFSLYEMPTASSVKTFCGKVYQIKGFVGVETKSGEVKHVTDLYYSTRSVAKEEKLIAKRKNKTDELTKLKKEKKIN